MEKRVYSLYCQGQRFELEEDEALSVVELKEKLRELEAEQERLLHSDGVSVTSFRFASNECLQAHYKALLRFGPGYQEEARARKEAYEDARREEYAKRGKKPPLVSI